MLLISDVVFSFSPDHQPVARVKPGDTVRFKTKDCFCDQVTGEHDLVTTIDFDRVNPASGPVFVEGAEPGDVLCAEILSIDTADKGIACTLPESGPLIEWCELRTKVIEVRDGMAYFNDLVFPVRPMVGVIGTAPASGSVVCGQPGAHGGNLDCKFMRAGAKAYFPVRTKGALFQLGDLHASMGDGEISGTGIEIGGDVTVRLHLMKSFRLDWPMLETDDMIHTLASGPEFVAAQREAARQMQRLVAMAWGWDETDAALYLSVRGDSAICQTCQPSSFDMVLRMGAPKEPSKPRLVPLP
jgi:amidase